MLFIKIINNNKMDPTRELCEIKDSFQSKNKIDKEIPKFIEVTIGSPRAFRNKLFLDKPEFKQLIEIKDDNKLSTELADPFQQIKDEYFKERSSLVLANIDLVFNFSDQDRGYIVLQYLNELDYAVLDGDAGFLKYLQFRLPNARGFTNCSIIKNKKIEKNYLNINCENGIAKYIKSIAVEGVNLVFSNSLNYKENLLNALKILKPEGIFISRIDTNTDLELLFMSSLCFESFTIFKPFLENLNEKNSYIICEKYKGNSIDIINSNFKGITVSSSFLKYIQNYYNSLSKLKQNLKDQKYNMYKCKAIMNII
jgi:hypothetical protein